MTIELAVAGLGFFAADAAGLFFELGIDALTSWSNLAFRVVIKTLSTTKALSSPNDLRASPIRF